MDRPLKSRSNTCSPAVAQHIVNTLKSTPTKTVCTGTCSHDAAFLEQGLPTITRASRPHQAPEEASTISHASSSHSSLTTTISSASLIQSAARSILYSSSYTPTSTTSSVSDDEDDSSDIRQIRRHHELALPTLHSLQRKTLPTMPNEHDRKRFVGCLAAILASAYDFDVADDEDGEDARAESYAYLNRSEQGRESDYGGEYDGSTDNYCRDFHNNDSNTNNKLDETSFLDTSDLYEEGEEVEFNTYANLSQTRDASFEYTDAHRPDIRISYSDSGLYGPHQRHHLHQYHHSFQSNRNQSTPERHRHQKQSLVKKNALAMHRHRKRRYDVLSKLLLSSAELLLLEESQARAFLPMLAQLLVPPTAAQKTSAQRIRRAKQQQPQRPPRPSASNANATRSATLARSSASASPCSPPIQAPSTTNSASSYSAASIATVINNSDKNASVPLSRENAKGINHYRFSNSYNSRSLPLANTNGYNNNNIFQHPCRPNSPDLVESAKEEDGFWPRDLDDEDHLRPFLESLSPGAGFRCLSLFILQHLLHSAEGYDARIRHAIKKVGVLVLLHDMELQQDLELVNSEHNDTSISPQNDEPLSLHSAPSEKKRRRRRHRFKYDELVGPATHKFEALEHSIAVHLIRISSKEQTRLQQKQQQQSQCHNNRSQSQTPSIPPSVSPVDPAASAFSREQIVRGLKIGSAGLVAGTLFAVTGGLAAPGISAGIAAIAGSTAATAAVAAIVTSTPAVTAIFGVGGGSLAAYKMNRRTLGLTEFEFRRQDKKLLLVGDYSCTSRDEQGEEQVELFSTVCISGWLRDEHDFQRPWGISPTNPRIRDRLELLERFYSVYRPDHVSKCKKILASWKGEEKQLWELLKQKYGRDPDHLYPILSSHENGFHRGLTLEQEEVLNDLFVEMGYIAGDSARPHQNDNDTPSASAFHNVRERLRHTFAHHSNSKTPPSHSSKDQCCHKKKHQFIPERPTAPSHNLFAVLDESLHGPGVMDEISITSSGFESLLLAQGNAGVSQNHGCDTTTKEHYLPPKHLATVWDYNAKYGGEVYTVKWESEMLIELCDSVTDLAFDVINGATAQMLRQTALSTLISAVALPYALVNAANMIDGTWTLAVERADEAGKELARSLLFSRAGHRPVTLVGFSFGARAIYSCLKELAKYQEKWEASRENRNSSKRAAGHGSGDSEADQYPCTLREPASIVEDAILMGLPNHLSLSSWKACRRTVGGRLVNCYSRKDLILSLMFQFKRLAGVLRPVCGTCPVEVRGVENVDISDLVSGHQDYLLKVGDILMRVRHGQPFRTSLQHARGIKESITDY